jgi:2-polyprenyl-3-methyl-5-hydroxy-6-metoxy-1,4-benzoquinol methylase
MSYNSYIEWKGWSSENFGKYSDHEAAFYKAEISDLIPTLAGVAVLEIGFGEGRFLQWARDQGAQVVGVEVQSELLTLARARGFKVQETLHDVTRPDGGFGLIAAFDVFEHLTAAELASLFQRCHALCARDTAFLIARFPNGDSPFSLPMQNGDPTHRTAWGSGAIRHVCRQSSWEIQQLRGVRISGPLRRRIVRYFKKIVMKCIEATVFRLYLGPNRPTTFEQNYILVCRPTRRGPP